MKTNVEPLGTTTALLTIIMPQTIIKHSPTGKMVTLQQHRLPDIGIIPMQKHAAIGIERIRNMLPQAGYAVVRSTALSGKCCPEERTGRTDWPLLRLLLFML